MKKTLTLIFSTITIISFAQLTGGGTVDAAPKENVAPVKDQGAFKKRFILNLAYSKYLGNLNKTPEDYLDLFEDGKLGLRRGFGLNVGQIIYLNKIDYSFLGEIGKQVRMGIDITYFTANLSIVNNYSSRSNISHTGTMFSSGAGVGVLFAYNPIKDMVIDLSFKLTPGQTTYALSYTESDYFFSYNNFSNSYVYDDLDISSDGIAFNLRKSMNISVRYMKFQFGIELSGAKVPFNRNVSYYSYNNINYYPRDNKSKTTRLDFKVGFAF